jgi:predicted N-formylglutamate amidohydrolase
MFLWSAVAEQAVAQTAHTAQAVVAQDKFYKQQFIYQPQHTQLRSALAVLHQQIKQAVTVSVHA